MRSRSTSALVCLAFAAQSPSALLAADVPSRKPLGLEERNAVLSLIRAVDVAQDTDAASGDGAWDGHVLRSGNQTAYVPFRVTLDQAAQATRAAVVYVRAVSRHDGLRAADERSIARDWLL